ncbi:hypothetical protein NLJ89_g9446 [Agrocybe chaxingu]|uniref:Uncharacterized protein n=1 Tax=Agrocybe chaxingu TaxID=84603 RepID=A0A9W8MRU0_9AGAR|nr:hypothetical protein NLJ89_g9446 [Agrocybe chaxingu]
MTPPVANDPQPYPSSPMQALVTSRPTGSADPLSRPETNASRNPYEGLDGLSDEAFAKFLDQAPPADDMFPDDDANMSDGDGFYSVTEDPQMPGALHNPPSYTPTPTSLHNSSTLPGSHWNGGPPESSAHQLIPASTFRPDPEENWANLPSKSANRDVLVKTSHPQSASGASKSGGYRPTASDLCAMCDKHPVHVKSHNWTCSVECSQKMQGLLGDDLKGKASSNSGRRTYAAQSSGSSYWNLGYKSAPIKMCEVCKTRPQYQKGGKTYPTCGLTCASKYNPYNVEVCDFCKQRPKLVVNGKKYPQCGRTCRDKAQAAAAAAANSAAGSCTTCPICWRSPGHSTSAEGYCSKACAEIAEAKAPFLIELPRGHVAFKKAVEIFSAAWKRRTVPCPTVKKIYRVKIKAASQGEYEAHRSKVSPHGLFKTKGNEQIRFIGTHRECTIGDGVTMEACASPKCLYCSVIRRNVSKEHFPLGIMTAQLERAVETASNVKKRTPKVVLMTNVLVGKSVKMGMAELSGELPPPGSDSVQLVGYQPHGGKLDLGEVLVFNQAAIKPLYVLTFE